jgi:FtsP/CotA-like multicopper oxidase with cupredoxin domain
LFRALAGFNFSIPNGNMKVVEIDGGNIIVPSPAVDSIGILYPGERMDVIISNDQTINLTVALDEEYALHFPFLTPDSQYPRNFQFQNQALTAIQSFSIISPKIKIRSTSENSGTDSISHFDFSTARSPPLSPSMSETFNQTFLIYANMEMLAHFDHVPKGFMNRTNWVPQAEPLIEIPRSEWDEYQFMPETRGNGEWVDIVVNNHDDKGPLPSRMSRFNFTLLSSSSIQHLCLLHLLL